MGRRERIPSQAPIRSKSCQTSTPLPATLPSRRPSRRSRPAGSRSGYAHVEENGGWRTEIDDNLAAFLAEANSFFLATASADGQPYMQHRGGPKGFVKILDKQTLAFADYSGNRQYITQGNLAENPKANIFIMDYAHRRPRQALGHRAGGRGRSGAAGVADATRLSCEARTGDPVHDRRVGHQLPAAYPAEIRCGRCGSSTGSARCADCGVGSRTGDAEGRSVAALKATQRQAATLHCQTCSG